MIEKIGTVEILRLRVYQNKNGEDIAVKPGKFTLFKNQNGNIFFDARGSRSNRVETKFEFIDDGLFAIYPGGDQVSDVKAKVRRSLTVKQFCELLEQPVAKEGDPEQRLRITLFDGGATQGCC